MQTGTKSLLFGVHQVFIHPVVVYRAWKHLYGRPSWRELICIIIHDWGYWGKPDLDGPEGERHPEFAARLAGRLFGGGYGQLCLYHSRHYAKLRGMEPSKLCWADKLSIQYEPSWFYLLRARLSGELKELRQTSADAGYLPLTRSDKEWFIWVRNLMQEMGQAQANTAPYMNKGVN
jgi:hypothetical protein